MRLLNNSPRAIERIVREPFDAPKGLASYASTALPKAVVGHIIWVSDLETAAVSDGVAWFPVTLGSAI